MLIFKQYLISVQLVPHCFVASSVLRYNGTIRSVQLISRNSGTYDWTIFDFTETLVDIVIILNVG